MKAIPSGLASHYALGSTTLATCWKATLTDGSVVAATTLDVDLVFGGVTYASAAGYSATDIDSSAELNPDNLEVEGFLALPAITDGDIQSGRWDYAAIEVFEVNYKNLAAGRNVLRAGTLGEVKAGRATFTAELRGLMQAYSRTIVRLTTKTCLWDLGDERCKVDLGPWTVTGAVQAVAENRIIDDAQLVAPEDHFTGGLLTFTSGANAGLSMEVKKSVAGQIELFDQMPYPVEAGDTYSVYAGCRKEFERDCIGKFDNHLNFGGFPHVPLTDVYNSAVNRADQDEVEPVGGAGNSNAGSLLTSGTFTGTVTNGVLSGSIAGLVNGPITGHIDGGGTFNGSAVADSGAGTSSFSAGVTGGGSGDVTGTWALSGTGSGAGGVGQIAFLPDVEFIDGVPTAGLPTVIANVIGFTATGKRDGDTRHVLEFDLVSTNFFASNTGGGKEGHVVIMDRATLAAISTAMYRGVGVIAGSLWQQGDPPPFGIPDFTKRGCIEDWRNGHLPYPDWPFLKPASVTPTLSDGQTYHVRFESVQTSSGWNLRLTFGAFDSGIIASDNTDINPAEQSLALAALGQGTIKISNIVSTWIGSP